MAPPKKWDDSSEEESSTDESVDIPIAPAPIRKKFDDEDSDDVADNWDEAEDSEEERAKATKAAAAKAKADAEAAANKKSKAQRVEEHREANRRRKLEEDDEESSGDEDDATRRMRLRQTEQDADLKHAQDLLAGVGLGPKNRSATNKAVIIEDKNNPGQAIDLSNLSLFKPVTKGQFEALSEVLVPLLKASSSRPHYSIWVANFVKQICSEMPSAEIRKAASGLTALSNEKMKEEKAAEKGGKKSKAAKSKISLSAGRDVGRGMADTTAYEDGLEEDDFM